MKTSIYLTETIENKVQEFISSLETEHTDIPYFIDIEEIDISNAFESIEEMLEGNLDVDIIYYHNAMEYLADNDTSLNESLELAQEMGFTLDNLNSEVLASLLASQDNREQFYNLEDKITNFFEEIEEEVNEIEALTVKNAQTGVINNDLQPLNLQRIESLGYKVNLVGGFYFAVKGNKGIKSNSLERIYNLLIKRNDPTLQQ